LGRRKLSLAALGVASLALTLTAPTGAAERTRNSNALWRVVHDLCLTDSTLTGLPAPCMQVNRRGGYAILKDPGGHTQVLLVPTTRVAGIESPKLQSPGAPNYWQAAWDSRRFVEREAKTAIAREDLGMAINSIYGRSQNQLHIHIDCVRPDVKASLAAHEGAIGRGWTPFRWSLAGEHYRVRRLDGPELGDRDPFKLLAGGVPGARADMGRQTLAVIGARFAGGQPGFVLLAAAGGTAGNPEGESESLLDHDCAVLNLAA
jgi:CDP-diacylglycerol pyrophosphatase